MTAMPNPTALTSTTRFRPTHIRAHSRSPSRSPVRRAQFTAQHLDPLLRNLSPHSTLKALQATDTIPAGPEQDILTNSIADATPEEREIGIRAAFAAQKLREWRYEISHWMWPGQKERALGLGFLPPREDADIIDENGQRRIYLGRLPLGVVDQYEMRIDEIRDALETLKMEEIKDHVLQAHSPSAEADTRPEPFQARTGPRKSYGRMRDFTALITATVIQALPDLAVVNMLIETWDIRLTVLRDLPMLLSIMKASKAGVWTAISTIRDPSQAPLVTILDFETTKQMLGDKVADLGIRIDRRLDLLEGQDDALPQGWIDSLETLELDYATWVVEAQRLAANNQSAEDSKQVEHQAEHQNKSPSAISSSANVPLDFPLQTSTQIAESMERELPTPTAHDVRPIFHDGQGGDETPTMSKPSLRLETPTQHGHRREISEVSIADSAYSAFSDISKAEIVDATQTQMLPSPNVSIVQSPSRAEFEKPPLLQRASTASIEVVAKDQLRRVDLRRSMSADLLSKMSHSTDSTPSQALEQLTTRPITGTTPLAELEDPLSALAQDPGPSSFNLPPSVLDIPPHGTETLPKGEENTHMPDLPRKSSKRRSMDAMNMFSRARDVDQTNPISPIDSSDVQSSDDMANKLVSPIEPRIVNFPQRSNSNTMSGTRRTDIEGESLEAKIQDILLNLPNKIRLAKNADGTQTDDSSTTSTRASTPTPGLTLSPVKASRRSSSSDAGVRVFHLTQYGQSRDTAPVKLFVRTVGENERVMVRVGGGWADLAEYLKEYSLHHGRRTVSEGKLEVAQYPVKQRKEPLTTAGSARNARQIPGQTSGRSRSPSPPGKVEEPTVWTPPPVPPIPAGFSMQSPVMTSITGPNGIAETIVSDADLPNMQGIVNKSSSTNTPMTIRSSTMTAPGVTTTTTISAPQVTKSGGKYTPLGAAGPKAASRRAVTFGETPGAGNDAWVEGVVGRARAVSSNVVEGPTTTTTTIVAASAPSSRRTSAMLTPSTSQKASKPALKAIAPKANAPVAPPREVSPAGRRRSILGLGDVGGIRRVFLRRKSEK